MAHEDKLIRSKRADYFKKNKEDEKYNSLIKPVNIINENIKPVNIINENSSNYTGNTYTPDDVYGSSFDDLRLIRNICDKDILIDFTNNDLNNNIRIEVVKRVHNRDILVDIAKNDIDADIRLEAVKRIHDEDILVDIAKYDSSSNVRTKNCQKYTG